MQVTPINTIPPIPEAGAAAGAGSALKTEFLTLLIAQIQQQDPLSPRDPSEFTSQLAQFSMLEQLVRLNDAMQDQVQLQATAVGTTAASFVGQQAEVLSDKISLSEGESSRVRFELGVDSAETFVRIYDAAGTLVRTVVLGPSSSGTHDFEWDGLNDAEQQLQDGLYRFEVKASAASGESIETETSTVGRITGVRFAGGIVLLRGGGENYTLSQLLALGESV